MAVGRQQSATSSLSRPAALTIGRWPTGRNLGPESEGSSKRTCMRTLWPVESLLTLVDSFVVTAELAPQLDGLELGKWYVVDGTFASATELPPRGSWVEVQLPNGHSRQVVVVGCEIRHGVAALSFIEPDFSFPRLSKVRRLPDQLSS